MADNTDKKELTQDEKDASRKAMSDRMDLLMKGSITVFFTAMAVGAMVGTVRSIMGTTNKAQ